MSEEKDELIVKQALKIEDLESILEEYRKADKAIHNIIYCIGGPLNDNILQYSHKQLGTFAEIVSHLNN